MTPSLPRASRPGTLGPTLLHRVRPQPGLLLAPLPRLNGARVMVPAMSESGLDEVPLSDFESGNVTLVYRFIVFGSYRDGMGCLFLVKQHVKVKVSL